MTIGAIAMLLPGIWLYIAWAFALPVLLVEGLRGPAALRRSYALVRGRWWRTFGVIALGFLLAIVISTLARGVFLVGLLDRRRTTRSCSCSARSRASSASRSARRFRPRC